MDLHGWRRISRTLTEDEAMEQERWRLAVEINASDTSGPELDPAECRRRLEVEHGQVWDSYELARDFEVEAFARPLGVVIRRADGARGTVVFQHSPRFHWGFERA
jgi:hypothetical protein